MPEVTAPGGEFESWPNRWDFQYPRFQRYENNRRMPWIVGSPFDPYNQNGAKGDFPIGGSQSLFANLTLQMNSTINPRQVGAGEDAPTSQTFDNHNFVGRARVVPRRHGVPAKELGGARHGSRQPERSSHRIR